MKGLCHTEGALEEELSHLQALLLKKVYSVAKKKEQGGISREDQNHVSLYGAAWDPWLIITTAKHFNPTHNPVESSDS